jgi:hypothetical protein
MSECFRDCRRQSSTGALLQRLVLLRLLSWLLLAGMVPCHAQQAIRPDQLVGLPKLPPLTKELAAAEMRRFYLGVFDELAANAKLRPFESLPGEKVAVACLTRPQDLITPPWVTSPVPWGVLKWSRNYGASNVDAARQGAVAYCEAYKGADVIKGNCTCIPVLEGNDARLVIDDAYVEKYLATATELAKKTTQASYTDVIDTESEGSKSRVDGPSVLLNLKHPIQLGNPDGDRDYAEACQGRVGYAWLPVEVNRQVELSRRLVQLQDSGLYGCYTISVNTTLEPRSVAAGKAAERRCRFTSSSPSGELPLLEPKTKEYLSKLFPSEKVKRVWGGGVVEVDDRNVPFGTHKLTSPLYVEMESGKGFRAVMVMEPENGIGCYVGKPFSNLVFDLAKCEPRRTCEIDAETALFQELENQFTSPPIAASRILGSLPPGEIRFERLYKPSLIIGAPFFEMSTYMAKFWSADSDNPLYSAYERSSFKGISTGAGKFATPRIKIFLEFTHFFTRSANVRGVYSEPDDAQANKYSEVIGDKVAQAISSACSIMGGTMKDRICVVERK